jgi:hypothetical protein
MIIFDLNLPGVTVFPYEADSILIVDPYRVLAGTISY